ncbi:radical SAM protein [Ancylomarina sp. YFZ004]
MYKYLFGPVPSRRLGMSLGVDLVPKKVCSLDCVYCEVGRTTKLSLNREEYINSDCIKDELKHYFENNPAPDYITVTASGEPTLNLHLGDIIQFIKQTNPDVSVAVITNGTLLHDEKVRAALMHADLLLPSLDAATDEVFKKINRPADNLSVDTCIQGLIALCNEFKGRIWLEVFILPGYNDHENELKELKKVIVKIKPESIQLNTLDRPGTVPNLRGATRDELQRIVDFWKIDNVEIIAKPKQSDKAKSFRKDSKSAIIETISRRPCTLEDLTEILGLDSNKINEYLDLLDLEGVIDRVEEERGVFYQLKNKNGK